MYVLDILTIDARTYIEEEILPAAISTHLLPYVRTFCTYLVLVYVPTDVHAHLLHILLSLRVHVRSHPVYCFH